MDANIRGTGMTLLTTVLLVFEMLAACSNQDGNGHASNIELGQSTGKNRASIRRRLAPPIYFVNEANKNLDITIIEEYVDNEITIDGHYSKAIVPCGTGCTAFWIVDRIDGAIIDVPNSENEAEDIYDLRAEKDNDLITIIYGPKDGSPGLCWAKSYKFSKKVFRSVTGRSTAPCP
jgi:hypothetical protein